MVDPDTFLPALCVMVDEYMKRRPAPVQPGPAARLTPCEVVTLALFGQWRQYATERAFYCYAVQHWRAAFPTLPARSQYNRLVRRCHDALVAVGQDLADLLDGRTSPYEALDGMGVATCAPSPFPSPAAYRTRPSRSRRRPPRAPR